MDYLRCAQNHASRAEESRHFPRPRRHSRELNQTPPDGPCGLLSDGAKTVPTLRWAIETVHKRLVASRQPVGPPLQDSRRLRVAHLRGDVGNRCVLGEKCGGEGGCYQPRHNRRDRARHGASKPDGRRCFARSVELPPRSSRLTTDDQELTSQESPSGPDQQIQPD